jgi:hypothetical protein
MAKSPVRLNLQDQARSAASKVRDALSAAKNRTGGEGRLVAFSAGGLFLSFALLAMSAPLLMQAPAIISNIVGLILFAGVVVSTSLGGFALWRMIKAGAMAGDTGVSQSPSIFSSSAVEAALSDAEDAGLRGTGPRSVIEAMTGRLHGRPIAVMRCNGVTYGVVRLKTAATASLLLAPDQAPWPFTFPSDGDLTPIPAPRGVDALAWSTQRSAGLELMALLAPALTMSAAGGDVPFVSLRQRALVLMWRKADVAAACVVTAEAAKAFG